MKYRIMHIVGNRPQLIKLAPVSREIRKRGHDEIIIHTGQHYDDNMSDIFFRELDISFPKENLNVGSGTHAQIIAKVISRLEEVILNEKPEGVIIYGDTNSTLAAAIVVSKLNIPLFHVEAGPRTYCRMNPEEQNRVVADHLSDYLFVPDKISADHLKLEGIDSERIIFSGDVMYDQFLYSKSHGNGHFIENCPNNFILMTWHRQENTCSKRRMENVLSFIEKIHYNIVFPIHPRTRKLLTEYGLWQRLQENENLFIMDPVGYNEMTALLSRCKLLVSDSGGASKEAAFAGKKCIFLLCLNVWPELVNTGYINIVNIEDEKSIECNIEEIESVLHFEKDLPKIDSFGIGNAAQIIVNTIEKVIPSF